jgi:hypothetical protein
MALASTLVLRAYCPDETGGGGAAVHVAKTECLGWPVASTAPTVVVQAPAEPAAPVVVLKMPSSVAACAGITLDLSASRGRGGGLRPWASVSLQITSSTVGTNATLLALLQQEGQRQLATQQAVIILPARLLAGQTAYTLQVTLCSFLGPCGRVRRQITVLAGSNGEDIQQPTVRFLGGGTRRPLVSEVSQLCFVFSTAKVPRPLSFMYFILYHFMHLILLNCFFPPSPLFFFFFFFFFSLLLLSASLGIVF